MDHHPGKVWAYGCGRRKANVFLRRQQWLAPLGITQLYTAGGGAYERHIAAEKPQGGQENTPTIESKHLKLRTRMKR
jgi:IS1 family transposase